MFGLLEKLIAEAFVLPVLPSSAARTALETYKYQLPPISNSQPPLLKMISAPLTANDQYVRLSAGREVSKVRVGRWAGHRLGMWELPTTTTDEQGGREVELLSDIPTLSPFIPHAYLTTHLALIIFSSLGTTCTCTPTPCTPTPYTPDSDPAHERTQSRIRPHPGWVLGK
jgi:hypothetical protein